MEGTRNSLCTSAEVLLHGYIPVGRWATLEAALTLVESCIPTVFSLEGEDVRAGPLLANSHPSLGPATWCTWQVLPPSAASPCGHQEEPEVALPGFIAGPVNVVEDEVVG